MSNRRSTKPSHPRAAGPPQVSVLDVQEDDAQGGAPVGGIRREGAAGRSGRRRRAVGAASQAVDSFCCPAPSRFLSPCPVPNRCLFPCPSLLPAFVVLCAGSAECWSVRPACARLPAVAGAACRPPVVASRARLPTSPPPLPTLAPCRRQGEAIAACYKLLPAVHRLFRRVAGEEDDYIAQPKVGLCRTFCCG